MWNWDVWAAGAFFVAALVYLKSWTSERPFLSADLPLTAEDFPEHCITHGRRWYCLRFRNDGNHPARIIRIALNTEVVFDPDYGLSGAERRYPTWMVPEAIHEYDVRGAAHVVGESRSSQWMMLGTQFEKIVGEHGHDDRWQVFLQILVEYEDNVGRLFRSMYQYRYDAGMGGFRLAWPSDPRKRSSELASRYVRHQTLRGPLIGLLNRLCKSML